MTDFPNAPYSVDPEDEWSILDADGDKVADASASLYKGSPDDLNIAHARRVRDAIIRASGGTAPDLLGRLQAIIDWADHVAKLPDDPAHNSHRVLAGPIFDEARAAIAKAKGEAE